jgi:hypothetical protein
MKAALATAACLAWFAGAAISHAADTLPAYGKVKPPPLSANGKVKPPPLPNSLAIEVISASYGHSGAHAGCVVTPAVKRSCNGRSRCVVDVSDELCQSTGQLHAGLILTLTVQYKCTPVVAVRTAHADKPFQVVINCGGLAGEFSPKIGSKP